MTTMDLPHSPLYDPKSKIQKLIFSEDINNIRLNLQGTGKLYTDPNFYYKLDDNKEWRRPKQITKYPIFVNLTPHTSDALQGALGDCWLIAGFQILTLHEKLFDHVVPRDQGFTGNYIGAFHFRFWQLGSWYDVVVDDRLPVYKKTKALCYAHSRKRNIFWAALLEKAYAKTCTIGSFNYSNLDSGLPSTIFQDVSGGIVEKIDTEKDRPLGTLLKWYVYDVMIAKAMMAVLLKGESSKTTGLFEGHSYPVTGFHKCAYNDPKYPGLLLLKVLNPWGVREWKGDWSDTDSAHWGSVDREIREKLNFKVKDDGEFWMDEKDFEKLFGEIWVCHLGPGQYRASRLHQNIKTWKTTSFYGEWVKGVSAGGAYIGNRHKNPQYRFLLVSDTEQDPDDRIAVVMELVQRNKISRDYRPIIGFFIYSLTKFEKAPPAPLNQDFFNTNRALNRIDTFDRSQGRAYVMSANLDPGLYFIVPCTVYENEESQFLLRIFTESNVELWEYDTQISKSPHMEDSPNEIYHELNQLFSRVSLADKEIDWIGLKQILETAMNPQRSVFAIMMSYLKLISKGVSKYLFQPNEDDEEYETGEIVFSKDECRCMIAMFDNDHSGKLSIPEFTKLWSKIRLWTGIYESHKDEVEGCVKLPHLRDALSSIGYDINKRTIHSLSFVYANERGNISITDFILCGVALETVLENYEVKRLKDKYTITFSLEDWVKNTLNI